MPWPPPRAFSQGPLLRWWTGGPGWCSVPDVGGLLWGSPFTDDPIRGSRVETSLDRRGGVPAAVSYGTAPGKSEFPPRPGLLRLFRGDLDRYEAGRHARVSALVPGAPGDSDVDGWLVRVGRGTISSCGLHGGHDRLGQFLHGDEEVPQGPPQRGSVVSLIRRFRPLRRGRLRAAVGRRRALTRTAGPPTAASRAPSRQGVAGANRSLIHATSRGECCGSSACHSSSVRRSGLTTS